MSTLKFGRSIFIAVLAALALTTCSPSRLFAQTAVLDSVAVDSTYSRIIPGYGEMTVMGGSTLDTRDRWLWRPARSLSQIFDALAGHYLRYIGESGASIGSSWLGGFSTQDRMMLDALPAGDPLTGRVNLSMLPLEQVESVEQLSDEAAALTGHRWNLVSRQFSTVRPVTAIRFVQEPDETILSDGFFTQNVARSTALTLGFQRHTSAGRFDNAALDAWDLRGRVRANLTESFNLAVFWSYGRITRGVNGGVEPILSRSIFDEVSAVVIHSAGYEINERTDLGFSGVLRLLGDSSSTTRFGLLQRNAEREYRRLPDLFNAKEQRIFSRAKDLVLTLEQRIDLSFLRTVASGHLGSTRIDTTDVFALRDVRRGRLAVSAEITAVEWLTPRAAIASVTDDGDQAREVSASMTIGPFGGLSATASGSIRPVFPTLQERFWNDSTVLRPRPLDRGEERSLSAVLSWTVDSLLHLQLTGFQRDQHNVVIGRPAQTAFGTPSVALTLWSPRWRGLTATARLGVGPIELTGSVTFVSVNVSDSLKQILPQWWGTAELAYQDRIFRDQLGLRTAVRTRFSDRLRGLMPDPPTGFEVANTDYQIGRAATIDLYGTLEIGQAFVSLSWENLSNSQTLRTAVYPMPGRQFKLGVRWVFLD